MKLDRHYNADGKGKYSLILNRRIAALAPEARHAVEDALKILAEHGAVDHGAEDEFFVIRLRDAHAERALRAYAVSAHAYGGDQEFAAEIDGLADKAAAHPQRQTPD